MDIFAHALWAYWIFHGTKYPLMAVLFSILPDLLSFGSLFVISLFKMKLKFGKPSIKSIPSWVYVMYNVTHSLVVAFVSIFLVYIIFRNWVWIAMLAWALHIIIDIPTHNDMFFPTPFLWPISDFYINGISWGTPWFMILNYLLLLILYLFLWIKK